MPKTTMDVYSPTQAARMLCHALHYTLGVVENIAPECMPDLCAIIADALPVMVALEQHGANDDEPAEVPSA